jgi:hypothetical protein
MCVQREKAHADMAAQLDEWAKERGRLLANITDLTNSVTDGDCKVGA